MVHSQAFEKIIRIKISSSHELTLWQYYNYHFMMGGYIYTALSLQLIAQIFP